MGISRQRWAWRRYQRGLRTIPVIVLGSLAIWALTGADYFWPGFVIAWAAVAMTFRSRRAMALGSPAELE